MFTAYVHVCVHCPLMACHVAWHFSPCLSVQVDGNSLQNVRHDEAVSLLKATGTKVVFKVEKNALRHVTPASSSDHERSPVRSQNKDIQDHLRFIFSFLSLSLFLISSSET